MWERWLRNLSQKNCTLEALVSEKNLQKSPILKHLSREVPSVFGKWAVLCSVEISGAGVGSPPRMVYQIDFFLLIFRTYGEKTSKTKREKGVTPSRESRYHNHPTSSILHPCYQLRDANSTYGISQNTPFLGFQLYAYPLLCLLKPIQIVHVAHVLSLAGLSSRTPWTLRCKRQCNFTYAAISHIIFDIWKTQFLELTGLIFLQLLQAVQNTDHLQGFSETSWETRDLFGQTYLSYLHLIRGEFYSRNPRAKCCYLTPNKSMCIWTYYRFPRI